MNSKKKKKKIYTSISAVVLVLFILCTQIISGQALTTNEKIIYNKLSKEIVEINTAQIQINREFTQTEVHNAIQEIFVNNPKVFYTDKIRWAIDITNQRTVFLPVYKDPKPVIIKKQKTLNNILNKFHAKGSRKNKIKTIHKHIIKNVKFNRKDRKHKHDIYGAAVERQTVCSGYAAYFKTLCDKYKIPCYIVHNKSRSHAWNVVKINGKWKNVDCTWDDRGKVPYYRYFLIPDSKLPKSHKSHTGPKCPK